jgi:hypothetical protein
MQRKGQAHSFYLFIVFPEPLDVKGRLLFAQGFLKVNFHLFLLLMAQGRTKDGLCITRVYSPHVSFPPPAYEV